MNPIHPLVPVEDTSELSDLPRINTPAEAVNAARFVSGSMQFQGNISILAQANVDPVNAFRVLR